LYQLFPNKEALFCAIVERTTEQVSAEISLPIGTLDFRTNLVNMGHSFLRIVTSVEGIVIYRTAVSEAPQSQAMSQSFFAIGPDRNHEYLARYLKTQSDAGLIDVPDPKMAAKK